MLRAETVAIKMEWIKAINDALRFREIAEKAKDALSRGDYKSALTLVAEARNVSGFEQNFVTALQWAQIAEMCNETQRDGANGVLKTLEFRQLHSGPIDCLDSTNRTDRKRYVITGGHDKLVVLWDMSTGEIVREMTGHATSVKTVAISEVGTAISGGTRSLISSLPLSLLLINLPTLYKCRYGRNTSRLGLGDWKKSLVLQTTRRTQGSHCSLCHYTQRRLGCFGIVGQASHCLVYGSRSCRNATYGT
jgi:hypothetical protein